MNNENVPAGDNYGHKDGSSSTGSNKNYGGKTGTGNSDGNKNQKKYNGSKPNKNENTPNTSK